MADTSFWKPIWSAVTRPVAVKQPVWKIGMGASITHRNHIRKYIESDHLSTNMVILKQEQLFPTLQQVPRPAKAVALQVEGVRDDLRGCRVPGNRLRHDLHLRRRAALVGVLQRSDVALAGSGCHILGHCMII